MKRVFGLTILLLGSALAATPASTPAPDLDAQFAKASQEYAAGDFKAAISDYDALVQAGAYSAALFYDLGNAYFRNDDFARALLNYERALALDPHDPEAAANLRLARDRAGALTLPPGPLERALPFATIRGCAIVAAIAFWIGVFGLAHWLLSSRRNGLNTVMAGAGFSIFVIAVAALYFNETGSHGVGLAIVTGGTVNARVATADTANSVLALPAGTEIKVVSKRGEWIYAVLPNDLQGWLPAGKIESVRL
jgi:tetratricopeptide (TPR) repeat protein